jgi:hypothetical protein
MIIGIMELGQAMEDKAHIEDESLLEVVTCSMTLLEVLEKEKMKITKISH